MRIRLIIILLAGVVATLVASAGNDVISQLDMAIFNHRTQVRNRAKNRDTFEKSIMEICPVLPEETL